MGIVTIAEARTFSVNSVEDINDLEPGNDLCVAYILISPPYVLPHCTLRGAIEETNALSGNDTVELPAGFYSLTEEGAGEDNSASGDLDILESLTIRGQGPEVTIIDGRSMDRLFDVHHDNIYLVLEDLTLINGRLAGTAGGESRGGSIRNRGELRLKNVVIIGGEVGRSEAAGQGGALYNQGTATIISSTIEAGDAREGGGIYNGITGETTLSSSTISENSSEDGGGVYNLGVLEVMNSTLSGNSASGSGGGMFNQGSGHIQFTTISFNSASMGGGISNDKNLSIDNSLVASNLGSNCFLPADLTSNGHNLDSDFSCGLLMDSDIGGVDPLLFPLANNGGKTRTHQLAPFSPARDKGSHDSLFTLDQRGEQRPWGRGADIGSVEAKGPSVSPFLLPLLPAISTD